MIFPSSPSSPSINFPTQFHRPHPTSSTTQHITVHSSPRHAPSNPRRATIQPSSFTPRNFSFYAHRRRPLRYSPITSSTLRHLSLFHDSCPTHLPTSPTSQFTSTDRQILAQQSQLFHRFSQHSILPTVPDRSNHHIFHQLLTCNRSPAATPLPHLRLLLLACCFPGHLSSFAARIHTILLVVSYSIRLQTDPDHSQPLYSRFSYRHPPSRSTSFNAAPRPLARKPRVHDMTLTSSFHRYFTAQYLLIPSTIP